MTNPAMRELFMHPRNPLRVKEALLSLLAGDIYGRTPIWRLAVVVQGDLLHDVARQRCRPPGAPGARRRRNIAHVGPIKGENVLADS